MLSRLSLALLLGFVCSSLVSATTVRFDTNVGNFDLQLNPTGNVNLQAHVDNIVSYVENGSYDLTVINRAAEGFVMQMGGFQAPSLTLPNSFGELPGVVTTDPVIVDADGDRLVDFDVSDLLNTRGTVSLALSSSANTGTSSFFVNLGTNSSLDADTMRFVPFAIVPDMATIDLIMSLNQVNYPDGGLAGDDVPFIGNDQMVIVERAFVLSDEEMPLAAVAGDSESVFPDESLLPSLPASVTVPEPPGLVLAVGALMLLAVFARRKN